MSDLAFVTGGTGFVGANLVRLLLERGFRVRCLARPGSDRSNLKGLSADIIEGDLLDKSSLKRACADAHTVYHLAADYRIWVPNTDSMFETNVNGTVNVLRAAAEAGAKRIVYCSSVAAIRPPRDSAASTESDFYESDEDIVGFYKKTKWRAERAALSLAHEGLPIVIVNPAAPIGPRDIKPTPTGKIIVDFLNRKMPSYIDTGLNVVDVRDVANGHLLAAEKGKIGERYILGGENLTLKEILDTLAHLTGLKAPRFKTPYSIAWMIGAADSLRLSLFGGTPVAPLDAVRMARYRMFYNASKARRDLGFSSRPSREALAAAVNWFCSNGYAPRPPQFPRLPESDL
ncbi:MAG: NAD-dependent dehydratase [Elusimicrobia bacterium]|nr:MAG: NAD-dependent dehydratase [Elusimicrobiota bacterium]